MSLYMRIRFACETVVARVGLALIPRMSRESVVNLARRLGNIGYHISLKTRKIASANVELAYGTGLTREEKREILRQSYRSFMLVLLDLFWFARDTEARVRKYVTVDASCDALRKTKPAISVTGHIGNWEILGQTVALYDPPFLAIAAPIKNPAIDVLLNRIRSGSALKIAYKAGAVNEALRILRSGGRVGVLLDQNVLPHKGGIFVEFFGRPATMSAIAELLALRTNLPIVMSFCVPLEGGRYVLRAPAPLMPEDFEKGKGVITRKVAQMLEKEIRDNPGLWLWMYKRWKFIPDGMPREGFPYYARPVPPKPALKGVEK